MLVVNEIRLLYSETVLLNIDEVRFENYVRFGVCLTDMIENVD